MWAPGSASGRAVRGYTLLELVAALALTAFLLGLAVPPVRRALAWVRARAARDAVAMGTARARALAVARGGAELVLDLRRATVWLEARDTATPPEPIGDARFLAVSAEGAAGDTVRVAYDGMGLGRMAGRTLRFRAGGAEARLTISAAGRARTW